MKFLLSILAVASLAGCGTTPQNTQSSLAATDTQSLTSFSELATFTPASGQKTKLGDCEIRNDAGMVWINKPNVGFVYLDTDTVTGDSVKWRNGVLGRVETFSVSATKSSKGSETAYTFDRPSTSRDEFFYFNRLIATFVVSKNGSLKSINARSYLAASVFGPAARISIDSPGTFSCGAN